MIIEGVADAREVVTVYNFEIADHHTYFVGRKRPEFAHYNSHNDRLFGSRR